MGTHSRDELDEFDKVVEWHVLGLHSTLTPGEQHLQDILQTTDTQKFRVQD